MEEIKKATRESYGEALVELGKENKNVVVYMQIDFLIWEYQKQI